MKMAKLILKSNYSARRQIGGNELVDGDDIFYVASPQSTVVPRLDTLLVKVLSMPTD